MPVPCPVCDTQADAVVRNHSREAAAQHFVPRSRDPRRHDELKAMLAELWGRDEVNVRRCPTCGLCFADPFVAGDETFYNLVTESDPRYPSDRWEFRQTLASLRALYQGTSRRVRLVELGAGDGAFLKGLKSAKLGPRFDLLAIDYDIGAVERLERSGFRTFAGSSRISPDERPSPSRSSVSSRRWSTSARLEHSSRPFRVCSQQTDTCSSQRQTPTPRRLRSS